MTINGAHLHVFETAHAGKRFIVEDVDGELHTFKTWDEAMKAGFPDIAGEA